MTGKHKDQRRPSEDFLQMDVFCWEEGTHTEKGGGTHWWKRGQGRRGGGPNPIYVDFCSWLFPGSEQDPGGVAPVGFWPGRQTKICGCHSPPHVAWESWGEVGEVVGLPSHQQPGDRCQMRSGGWGVVEWVQSFSLEDGKVLEIDGCDSYTVWIRMPLNSTLKQWLNGKFHVIYLYIKPK